MQSNPEIDVVTVNWNAGEMLSHSISSLDAAWAAGDPALPAINFIVVDNASTDGSAQKLSAVNFQVTVIRNQTNLGFAAGCNQGVANGSAPFILFLNPDVFVHSPEAVITSLEFLRNPANSDYGICGVQLLEESGEVARSLSPFPTPWRCLGWMTGLDRVVPGIFPPHFLPRSEHLRNRPADSIMGAFLMIQRTLFEKLEGFSTSFFVYYEDVDLCRRALNAGFKSRYVADVSVAHEGCGTTRNIKATRYFYSTRSRIIYGLRHFSPAGRFLTAIGWMTIDPIVRVLYSLARFSLSGLRETVRGTALLWANAPEFMREEKLKVSRTTGRGGVPILPK